MSANLLIPQARWGRARTLHCIYHVPGALLLLITLLYDSEIGTYTPVELFTRF